MDASLPLPVAPSALFPQEAAAAIAARRGPAITVLDGCGGALSVDLSSSEVRWLADACHCLLHGALPQGASALKVRTAEKCYLVSRRANTRSTDDACDITIANLFDPGESVTLPSGLASLVTALIEASLVTALIEASLERRELRTPALRS